MWGRRNEKIKNATMQQSGGPRRVRGRCCILRETLGRRRDIGACLQDLHTSTKGGGKSVIPK